MRMHSIGGPWRRAYVRRTAVVLGLAAAGAWSALADIPAAEAAVVFPAPGVMRVGNLPPKLRAGHTFTLREVLPMAVWSGSVRFQEQTGTGAWHTLASAAVSPRVFWLHLWVPARWSGAHMTVRFVLLSKAQTLAMSPSATMTVSGSPPHGSRR